MMSKPEDNVKSPFLVDEECFFTREQLLERDYDPIEEGDVGLEYLKSRYEHHVDLDHAAAVRAILVREGRREWNWIWGIGLLHDHILRTTSHTKLYARYRNQRAMLPRIEFHGGADIHTALKMLLVETPLEKDDVINIEAETGGRWMSIGHYLEG
jgi:hypothetical protein